MSDISFDEAEVLRETEAALLIRIDGAEHWIPKSQISDDSEIWKQGDKGMLVVTEWIATQKGLV